MQLLKKHLLSKWSLVFSLVLLSSITVIGSTPSLSKKGTSANQDLLSTLTAAANSYYNIQPPLSLEVAHQYTDTQGTLHARFKLKKSNVPVYYAYVAGHITNQSQVLPFTGTLDYPGLSNFGSNPNFGMNQAKSIFTGRLSPGTPYMEPKITLFILPQKTITYAHQVSGNENAEEVQHQVQGYRLIYQVHASYELDGVKEMSMHIDANSGEIIDYKDVIYKFNGHSQHSFFVDVPFSTTPNGIYQLIDPARGTGHTFCYTPSGGSPTCDSWSQGNAVFSIDKQPRDPTTWTGGVPFEYSNSVNYWGNGSNYEETDPEHTVTSPEGQTAAVDVSHGVQVYWDLLLNVFGQTGLDNLGGSVRSYVHVSGGGGLPYANAYFNKEHGIFGFEDPSDGHKQATSRDIVGHELTHGLINFAVGEPLEDPEYVDTEWDAINEGVADVMGVLTGYYASQLPGPLGATIPDTGYDWVIGAQVEPPEFVRYLYKPSKDTYSKDYYKPGDMAGLSGSAYGNSGPIRRAFYFLSAGADDYFWSEKASVELPDGMTGVGNTITAKLLHRALVAYVLPGDDMMDFRRAMLDSAVDFGADPSDPADVTRVANGYLSKSYKAVQNAFGGTNIGKIADATPPNITTLKMDRVPRGPTNWLMFTVTAADDSPTLEHTSGMHNVKFLIDGAPVKTVYGSGPNYYYVVKESDISSGTHIMSVHARDNAENFAGGGLVFEADSIPPEITDIEPTGPVKMRSFTVKARDAGGITSGELWVDGVLQDSTTSVTPLGGDLYQLTLNGPDMSSWPTGAKPFKFIVVDSVGLSAEMEQLIRVDNTPPVVNPEVSGSSGNITLSAEITDDWIITAKFYVDGVEVKNFLPLSTPPYEHVIDSTTYSDGSHTFKVVADDFTWGNVTTVEIPFEIDNTTTTPPPPPGMDILYETEYNDVCATANSVSSSKTHISGGVSFSGDWRDNFMLSVNPSETIDLTLEWGGTLSACYSMEIFTQSSPVSAFDTYVAAGSGWDSPISTSFTNSGPNTKNYCLIVHTSALCPPYLIEVDR